MSITLVSKLEGAIPFTTISYAQYQLLQDAAKMAGVEFSRTRRCPDCALAEVDRAALVQTLSKIQLHLFRNPTALATQGRWQSQRTSRVVLLTTLKALLEELSERTEKTLEIHDDRRLCSHPKRK
jgi:hypothetical protein